MRANKIEQIIREHYAGVNPSMPTCDGFVCGDPDTDVTGVVTTFTVTADVLREAERKNANMIITHEPTFLSNARALGRRRMPYSASCAGWYGKGIL